MVGVGLLFESNSIFGHSSYFDNGNVMKRRTPNYESAYERLKKHRFVNRDFGSSDDSDSSTSTVDCAVYSEVGCPEQDCVSRQPEENRPVDHNSSIDSTSNKEGSPGNSPENLGGATGSLNISLGQECSSGSDDSESDTYYSNDTNGSDSSDSDLYEEEEKESSVSSHTNPIEDLKSRLKSWSLKNSIRLKALTELLALIRLWFDRHFSVLNIGKWLGNFPKDGRTLLKTAITNYQIRPMSSHLKTVGEFVYIGIEKNLMRQVSEKYFPEHKIFISVGADGIPLYRSSSLGFWVLMGMIYHSDFLFEPFPIAIYSGPGKPGNINDFLEEYVEEISLILENGIFVADVHYIVEVRCYICDTPARSFMKNTIGHGGFFCCERCVIKGATENKRRVYPSCESRLRTENSFFEQEQEEHHNGTTPLIRIPGFKPISSFVLDYMHNLCLGIMKRLLQYYWIGNKNKKKQTVNVALRATAKSKLSDRLEQLRHDTPSDFSRKPRGVDEIPRYKAKEYRFILVYCGPLIFKDILPSLLYKHFLLLHTGTRLLCWQETAVSHAEYAKQLYKMFFQALPQFYGNDSQILNMHNLTHIADDVVTYKCPLDDISAFAFESALGKMKRTLRSAANPLAQLCRRYSEKEDFITPVPKVQKKPLICQTSSGKIKVRYLNTNISSSRPNNFVLLHSGEVIEIVDIVKVVGQPLSIIGCVWKTENIFEYPCKSSELEEWKISSPSITQTSWPFNQIKSKLVHLSIKEDQETYHYASSLLHTSN